MGGRSSVTPWTCAAISAIALSTVAFAEAPTGQSKSLGISFKVLSDKPEWCNANVSVQLVARKASTFAGNREALQQTIGRIRAIIVGECPGVQKISFQGIHNKRPTYQAASWRLARWRLVELNSQGMPVCPASDEPCDKRSAGFIRLLEYMASSSFRNIEFTRFLDASSSALVEWRDPYGNVGHLKQLTPAPDVMATMTTADAANRLMRSLLKQCISEESFKAQEPLDLSPAVSLRAVRCRTDKYPLSQYSVVQRVGRSFYVYTFASFESDDSETSSQARHLADEASIP